MILRLGVLVSLIALLGMSSCPPPGGSQPGGPGTSIAPMITQQPASQSVTAGQTATFTVMATGTAPLSYQWQKNNSAITNAPNSPSYTTPVLTTGDNGVTFQVIVSNGVNPSAMSNSATLTVNPAAVAPTITAQPANVTVTAGATATFTVVATGTAPLSYQWQKNNSAIMNAPNSPSYTTPVLAAGDSGSTFRVVVSNGVNPPATSNACHAYGQFGSGSSVHNHTAGERDGDRRRDRDFHRGGNRNCAALLSVGAKQLCHRERAEFGELHNARSDNGG